MKLQQQQKSVAALFLFSLLFPLVFSTPLLSFLTGEFIIDSMNEKGLGTVEWMAEEDNTTTEQWKTFNVTTNNGTIASLLSSIVLHLPPTPVSVPALNMDMLLTNLTCFSLAADNITGAVYLNNSFIAHPPAEDGEGGGDGMEWQGLYLNLTVNSVSFNCTSDFFYEITGFNKRNESGVLQFTAVKSLLSFDVRIYQLPPPPSNSSSNSSSSSSSSNALYAHQKRSIAPPSLSLAGALNLDRHGDAPLSPSSPSFVSSNDINNNNNNNNNGRVRIENEGRVRIEMDRRKIQNKITQSLVDSLLSHLPLNNDIHNNNDNNDINNEGERREGGRGRKEVEGNGVIESARVFNGTVSECAMEADVNEFNSNSTFLNSNSRVVMSIIEGTIPDVVCDQINTLVSSNITSLINNISFALYNATESFYNYQYPNALDEKGAIEGIIFCSVLAVLFVSYYAITEIYYKRKAAAGGYDQSFHHLNHQSHDDDDDGGGGGGEEKMKGGNNVSMMRHPKIHWVFRYGILLFFMGNIALFISATISVAASVYIYLTLPYIRYQTPSLYTFTLVSSVVEMWEAGIWPLALLIGGASGVWPYVKLALLIFCWLVPPSIMGGRMRGITIIILDALGKWSLIDAYVLVLFLESFRVHFDLLKQFISFDMVVIPEYAFYAYLLGLMGSLSISHVVLYFHKVIEEPRIPITVRESLFNHTFKIDLLGEKKKKKSDEEEKIAAIEYSNKDHYGSTFSPSSPSSSPSPSSSKKDTFVASFTTTGKVAIIVVLVFTIIVSVIGYFVRAFEFSYATSLVGYLLEPVGDEVKEYSIASLTYLLPQATLNDPGDIGVRIIQVTFFMFSFAIPMLFLISLILLWIVPMTSKEQHNYFVVVEIVSAWAAVDVFIVAVFVSLLELEQFAIFVVGDRCDGLDALLGLLPVTPDDFTCFTVKATLSSGSWILLFAVIVLDIVGYSIMIFCRRAIYERMHREIDRQSRPSLISSPSSDQHLHGDEEPKKKMKYSDYNESGDDDDEINPTAISLTYSLTSTIDSIKKSPFYVRCCHSLSCITVRHVYY